MIFIRISAGRRTVHIARTLVICAAVEATGVFVGKACPGQGVEYEKQQRGDEDNAHGGTSWLTATHFFVPFLYTSF
jgi:hypothetical protein